MWIGNLEGKFRVRLFYNRVMDVMYCNLLFWKMEYERFVEYCWNVWIFYIKVKINEYVILSLNLIYKGKRIDEEKISFYLMIKFLILFIVEK